MSARSSSAGTRSRTLPRRRTRRRRGGRPSPRGAGFVAVSGVAKNARRKESARREVLGGASVAILVGRQGFFFLSGGRQDENGLG